jgi:hypothetical protein
VDVTYRATIALAVTLAGVCCGAGVRTPLLGTHPAQGAEPVVVDYPPPPAQVENIDRDPGTPCVWVDGHWDWVGRRWQWFPGGWVRPPEGCYYAPPNMVWIQSTGRGVLYYTRPRWYPEDAAELEAQQVLGACVEARACGAPRVNKPQATVRW